MFAKQFYHGLQHFIEISLFTPEKKKLTIFFNFSGFKSSGDRIEFPISRKLQKVG